MTDGGSVGAIIVAAGRSERMGFDKLWEDLGGKPVMAWSLEAIASSLPDRLVIVTAPDSIQRVERLVHERGVEHGRPGGARRRDSVTNGLYELGEAEWIVVHDAARPLVSAELAQRGLEAAMRSGAAVPALPLADTIKRVDHTRVAETIDRASLRAIQTPQIFRRALLAWALRVSDDDSTDEAGLIESLGGIVYTFQGQSDDLKLTYPDDLILMREIARRRIPPTELS